MAKQKGVSLPVKSPKKGAAPKALAASARKKSSHLSEERVVDSDSDSTPGSIKPGASLSKDNVKRKSNTEPPKVATSKKTKPANPPVPSDSSSEEEDDDEADESSSSSGSGSSSPEPQKKMQDVVATSSKKRTQPPQVNGVKRKVQEQSSSESESEESSESSDEEGQASKIKKAKTSSSGTSESSEDSESSSVEATQTKAKQNDQTASAPGGSRAVSAKAFQPPPGYSSFDPQASKAGPIIRQSDLEGAEIWHIAAPSSIPLTSIQSISLDLIGKGEPILKHEGINYVLQGEPSNTSEAEFLMLPGEHDYKPASTTISRSLHLQQQIVLPNLSRKQANPDTGAAAAADISRTAVSTIRPQPKGLRMRYKPAGFGPGRPGIVGSDADIDDEETQSTQQQTLQFPAAMGAHGVAEKESAFVDGASRTEHAAKKKHQKKKESSVNGEATTKKPRSNSGDTPMADAVFESKEDKAKRKEEKRQRKEAKKARPSLKGPDAS